MILKFFLLFLILYYPKAYALQFIENSDITDQINDQITKHKKVEIPSGKYFINATKSIKLISNTSIIMSKNTKLYVIPNGNSSYRVFDIRNVENVKIYGGQVIGDKYTHLNSKGEWGMGIDIRDSQNIEIYDMTIEKMWGDAIYLGNNGKNNNKNILIKNIIMDDNRRQGISIISVDTLVAKNITIKNTSGKSPMNGVDIEPNNPLNILKNINFSNTRTINNKGTGFQISLKMYNKSKNKINISLLDFSDHGSKIGLRINGAETPIIGSINITNIDLNENKISNFCFKDWNRNKIKVNIKNIKTDKPYTNKQQWCSNYKESAYLIFR
ncbi:right-handed parallel beta-helix repeat-containing protein [Acinetobacter junii]|uniref:right-handed parallel beta-helix repeat-containing protein n=1 Tax=Acinetobacter junii TaxID=40215 RepID=UPI003A886A27